MPLSQIDSRLRRVVPVLILLPVLLAAPTALAVQATGGNVTNDFGEYRIHIFTNSATASNFVVTVGGNIEVLVVAGGGGGGNNYSGGGGGAGGLVSNSSLAVTSGTNITVTVGMGGAAASDGSNSVFGSLVAMGGGGGGSYSTNGRSGGSGGGGSGGSAQVRTGGSGAAGQGTNGGNGYFFGSSRTVGGGGGGAGQVGANYDGPPNGGNGLESSISGSSVFYAGGGGGGSESTDTPGNGGNGGGGAGSKTGAGTAGAANRGGGGGGAGSGSPASGGAGGSGIIIVKYLSVTSLTVSADSPSAIGTTSAQMNGTVVYAGGAENPNVYICWDATDKGTNLISDWTHPLFLGTNWGMSQNFSTNVTGLLSSSAYVYRCYVTNSTGFDWSEAVAFTTAVSETGMEARGGNATNTVGDYRIHIFTNSATASNFVVTVGGNIEVLVVAGGGGGGGDIGGGGGAGGLIYSNVFPVSVGDYAVTVGAGGLYGTGSDHRGSSGSNSAFGILIASGGGGGGSWSTAAPLAGGSGGGGYAGANGAAASPAGQGYAGGNGGPTGSGYPGGGGGGAGSQGTNGTATSGGQGGSGRYFSQFVDVGGSPAGWFAGGGGGGVYNNAGPEGQGGAGGGGAGGKRDTVSRDGTNGVANTGGGGGGASRVSPQLSGGLGGSGIVIVKYLGINGITVSADLPTVGTTNATLRGTVAHAGGGENPGVYVCWDTTDKGTGLTSDWAHPLFLGTNWGKGQSFSTNIAGLLSGSSYVYRCYVTNSTGFDWSDTAQSFFTVSLPAVTNPGAASVQAGTAVLQGEVTSTGNETPTAWFEYWATGSAITTTVARGAQSGVFSSLVTGFETLSSYAYRVVASNAAGKVYSETKSFTTLGGLYVALSGDNSTGTNWASAYTNLQTAVNAAGVGAVIYVKADTFGLTNQIDLSGKVNLAIRGGYAGAAPEPGALAAGPSVFVRTSGAIRLFYGNATTVTLERVEVQGGYLTDAPSYGAGLCFDGNSSVRLLNCTVTNNQCSVLGLQEGAGLYINGGNLTIEGGAFVNNSLLKPSWPTDSRGGGIYASSAAVTITNTVFDGNYTWCRHYPSYGGAICAVGGSLDVTDCMFTNNRATADTDGADSASVFGGAVHINGTSPFVISGCTFVGNYCVGRDSTRQGDVLYVQGAGASGRVLRSVAVQNGCNSSDGGQAQFYVAGGMLAMTNVLAACGYRGSAVLVNNAAAAVTLDFCTLASNYLYGANVTVGSMTVRNSIAWGNGSGGFNNVNSAEYSCSQEVLAGTGNLNTDPLFVDGQYFHIQARAGAYTNGFFSGGSWVQSVSDSPALNAANPAADYDREPDPSGFRANMGAYGNSSTASKTYLEAPGVFTVLTTFAHPALPLSPTSARLRGQVLSAGGAENPEACLCWGTADGGTVSTSGWQNVRNMGSRAEWELFTHDVSGLTNGITYHCRAHVTNSTGEDWSSDVTFGVQSPAAVSNSGPYRVQRTAARLRGQVSADGGDAPFVWFWHWQDGSAVTSITAVGEFAAPLSFSATQTGLVANTLYHYRILASNQVGESWSDTVDYTTLSTNPIERYVTVNGAGIFDGSSWTNAYIGINDALEDCAYPRDTVYMRYGSYVRNTQIDVSRLPGVAIKGGYEGIGAPGALTNQATLLTRASDKYIRIFYGSATTVTLQRVTVAGGYLAASGEDGAGLYFVTNSILTLRDCVFANNQCYAASVIEGGAVYLSGAALTVENCTFLNNALNKGSYDTAPYGGAVWASGAAVTITNTLFAGNSVWCRHCPCYGGALYTSGGSLQVSDCTFSNNRAVADIDGADSASVFGGAVHINGTSPFVISDCLFVGNYCVGRGSTRQGDVLYVQGAGASGCMRRSVAVQNGYNSSDGGQAQFFVAGGTLGLTNVLAVKGRQGSAIRQTGGALQVVNCTLADNSDWAVNGTPGSAVVRSCIAWGNMNGGITNVTTTTYTCSQEAQVGNGNMTVDPLFVDTTYYHLPSRAGYYAGGYFSGGTWNESLTNSPLIDAGDLNSDHSLEMQPNGNRVNMGYDGNTPVASLSSGQGTVLVIH